MSTYISNDLIRFRSVSRSLSARISSPYFIRKHALRSSPKYLIRHMIPSEDKDYYTTHSEVQLPLYYSGGYDDKTTFKFPYNDTFELIGSCNGILCVREHYGGYFSLWNPSVRVKRQIPDDARYWAPNYHDRSVASGFGFDSVNDDYKIVSLYYSRYGACSFVYTMKTNAWCKIQAPSTPFSQVSSYACLFNGALYWIARCDSSRLVETYRRYILTFDLRTHVFDKIVLPKPDWEVHILAIIKGSLAVFCATYKHKKNGIWLREEHDDTSSWSAFFESNTAQFYKSENIFELTATGDFLFYSKFFGPKIYNLETGVSKRHTERLQRYQKVNIENFVESLELLGKGAAYEE